MEQDLARVAKKKFSQKTIIESNVVKIKLNDNKKVEFEENYQDPKVTFKDIGKKLVRYCETETNNKHLLKCSVNPFVEAVRIAYGHHYPLVITPDIIWYLITCGVCKYMNDNAEELRDKFVDHEGKKNINIEILSDWNEAVEKFCKEIQNQTKTNVANLIINDFSTTTKCSKLVSQIVMMDSFKEYFKYRARCVCGIPEIQIKGTQNDWLRLREKMRNLLKEFPELKNWSAKLEIILEHFINAYDNKVDYDFWSQIYLLDSFKNQFPSYGRSTEIKVINGWMIYLFLYVGNRLNRHVLSEDNKILNLSPKEDYEIENFKHFLNKAPFMVTERNSLPRKCSLAGGLIGLDKDEENNDALTPIFGIALLVTRNGAL